MSDRLEPFNEQAALREVVSITRWTVGSPITRENACDFLRHSFVVSRGRIELQDVFLREVIRAGLLQDVPTLKTLIQHLNETELRHLADAYNKTPQHKLATTPQSLHSSLLSQIDDLIGLANERWRVLFYVELIINADFRQKVQRLKRKIRAQINRYSES